jgi:hypothetical protein
MRHFLFAAALLLAVPAAANPAESLSLMRASAPLEGASDLGGGTSSEIWPIVGLVGLAVLVLALADEEVEGEGAVSA